MSHEPHDPHLTAVEAALAALAPASRLDRDQLLFRAGQASVPRFGWRWPAATGVMTLATVALTLAWVLRPSAPVVERVVTVVVHEPAPSEPPAPSPGPVAVAGVAEHAEREGADYLKVREQVLRWGVDYLPAASGPGPSALARPGENLSDTSLRLWGRLN
jgi:hypothetical protein